MAKSIFCLLRYSRASDNPYCRVCGSSCNLLDLPLQRSDQSYDQLADFVQFPEDLQQQRPDLAQGDQRRPNLGHEGREACRKRCAASARAESRDHRKDDRQQHLGQQIYMASGVSSKVISSDLKYIGERLDGVFNAAQKGSHTNIDLSEAKRFVIHTYLVVGDILELHAEASAQLSLDLPDTIPSPLAKEEGVPMAHGARAE